MQGILGFLDKTHIDIQQKLRMQCRKLHNKIHHVRQEYIVSCFFITLTVYWVITNKTNKLQTGIAWTHVSLLERPIYADELALLSHSRVHAERTLFSLVQDASSNGLNINARKTKVVTTQPAKINNLQLECVMYGQHHQPSRKTKGWHDWVKPGMHLQSYNPCVCHLCTSKRRNPEFTRAMSSLCSRTSRSVGSYTARY